MGYGLIMANRYNHNSKSEYVCVDWDRAAHARSSNANHNGGLLYTTEMQTSGHSSGDESQYGHDRELSCAVCSSSLPVYTRWGSRTCANGATKLYEGFMANDYYTHPGSGYNYLCMHPQPQWPSGMNTGNQDGALLYGVEYENTGAVDKNYQKDAACAVCQQKSSTRVPYVQWGRKSCSNGHKLEYYGLIMANRYNHNSKSEYVCVDWDRAAHARSSNANHNGGLLYTTEMQTTGHSSGDEQQYGHDRELSCAVCNPRPKNTVVYTRWGSRSCPSGTTKLYEGFVASDYYTHAGSGANYLCMHPKPEFPPGMSTGNQDGALIYGVEYENTGAVDKNAQKDAACAVCQRMGASSVYVQWGRQS